jgi:hypothetical protein
MQEMERRHHVQLAALQQAHEQRILRLAEASAPATGRCMHVYFQH